MIRRLATQNARASPRHLAELQNAIDKAITTYAKENNLDKEQTKELRKAYDIKELRKKAESAWER